MFLGGVGRQWILDQTHRYHLVARSTRHVMLRVDGGVRHPLVDIAQARRAGDLLWNPEAEIESRTSRTRIDTAEDVGKNAV